MSMEMKINPMFSAYKNNLIQQLKLKNCLPQESLEVLNYARSRTKFYLALEDVVIKFHEDNFEKRDSAFNSCIEEGRKFGHCTLEAEQLIARHMEEIHKKMLDMFKLLTRRDLRPDVLDIKHRLKGEFGIKEVYLNDNPNLARKCLEAMKVLKKNDVALPDEIIGTDLLLDSSREPFSIAIHEEKEGNAIIINPDVLKDDEDWTASTDSPIHTIVHECIHCTQPNLMSFNLKKIPAKFKDTISKLSYYARDNYMHEVHAELLTKKVLKGLNSKEKELLNYIENSI